ncbi:MAG: MerR family transcriptional regulator [Flavobacteriaceae bacterium TMED42]|nr:MAG: MerR family transcriptional regulator [Kiritimatiellaceae bacterium TMED266]RPG63286.1 MAG: MerR family transcriptional regulator [Flavobacteriaceae bacterium TMED42]|tara:strand:+ start:125 stop:1048 length:924 start_codon:yes stop_codon:yes gene_type:complete
MSRVKSNFSIKDLENISGIKAHTIRIWEKRYNLLSPDRTDTNIRRYSLNSLQKLLNITLLYNHGLKISKIASLDREEIPILVREIALKSNSEQVSVNALKLSMINFDTVLFDATYEEILLQNDFDFVFINIFMPLMNELGILWQTNAISPSHEHFITNLIKQKIHTQTESLQKEYLPQRNNKVFVLYLPEDEIHEMGVLFLNYFILKFGYRTIFLGQSLQTESLETLLSFDIDFCFVTYLTVEPNKEVIDQYIEEFYQTILKSNNAQLAIMGPQQVYIDLSKLPQNIHLFKTLDAFQQKFMEASVFV